MKRFTILCSFLIIISFYICAGGVNEDFFFLSPLSTTSINLRSNMYPEREGVLEYNKGEWTETENPPKNIYYDKNIILSGGYAEEVDSWLEGFSSLRDDLAGTIIKLHITTDNSDMVLISQSNSAYKFPFKLYLNMGTSSKAPITDFNDLENIKKYDVIEINKTWNAEQTPRIEFTKTDFISKYDGTAFYFDLIIALPGEFDPNNPAVLRYNGKDYKLAQKDDYTCTITIHMEAYKDNNLLISKEFIVPISGYFSMSENYDETRGSLNVKLLPAASNLNIEKDAGHSIQIGTMEFAANYGYTEASSANRNIQIFLSSSSNPELQGEPFTFVNDNAENISSTNSLGFDLALYYNGSDTESYPDPSPTNFDGTSYTLPDQVSGSFLKVVGDFEEMFHTGQKIEYYAYSGDIYILIDKPTGILSPGLYEEDVYIHVVEFA